MRQSIYAAVLALVLSVAATVGASPARAQVLGIPVYNSGIARGIGLYGDVGFPNAAAGKGTAFGLTGRAGFGPLGVTAIVSFFNPDGPAGSVTSVGGTGNLRVFGGPLVPLSVTLQGGVGYAKPDGGVLPSNAVSPVGAALALNVPTTVASDEVSVLHFPVGVGFALTIPNPVLAIKPWLAPRVDVTRTKVNGVSDTDTQFALSGGLEFNLLSGLGFHAAYDYRTGGSSHPGVFGVGAHYTFRVPGL
jgi:opacity protein-like surface antigen